MNKLFNQIDQQNNNIDSSYDQKMQYLRNLEEKEENTKIFKNKKTSKTEFTTQNSISAFDNNTNPFKINTSKTHVPAQFRTRRPPRTCKRTCAYLLKVSDSTKKHEFDNKK